MEEQDVSVAVALGARGESMAEWEKVGCGEDDEDGGGASCSRCWVWIPEKHHNSESGFCAVVGNNVEDLC